MSIAIAQQKKPSGLGALTKYSDIMVALGAVFIVGMMIVPMPHWMLDMLLGANITLALTVLLVTIYTVEPLQFCSFPSLLLIVTLFRLALNISATRLILLHADAGAVINAFGQVVVGGNYVVGIVVFIILVIIQFVVITSGAGRVAEVAARFTLDAMPGKQMAIDADLNAGIIDEQEAQKRRRNVSREADFYGAMDGASKFVRGDAIAAIVMIIVNVLGGFVVGVAQKGMDLTQALQTYTLLTVGEGLVTQVPALLISTSTGLMVTKAASEANLGWDLASQVFSQPKAVGIAASIFAILGIMPGFPKVPFLLVAGLFGLIAYFLMQNSKAAEVKAKVEKEREQHQQTHAAPKAPESMVDLLGIDPIELEIGYGLIPLADPKQGGDLLERITVVRRQAAMDLGLLVPAIRVRDNMQLGANQYAVKLRGIEIARGEIFPGQFLAMDPGTALEPVYGVETVEPAFGLPAIWISEVQRPDAEISGYTVVDPLTVLITHLSELVRKNAPDILTRQDVQTLIENIKVNSPAVVDELIPGQLGLADVQKVLQNLLSERVSIRDMHSVLEALGDCAGATRDADILTEYVRQRLARSICQQHVASDGTLTVFTLHPQLEQFLADSLRQTEMGVRLILEPSAVQNVLTATKEQVEGVSAAGRNPVALCSPRIRPHFRRLVEHSFPMLAVMSYNEIASDVSVESVGMVTVNNED